VHAIQRWRVVYKDVFLSIRVSAWQAFLEPRSFERFMGIVVRSRVRLIGDMFEEDFILRSTARPREATYFDLCGDPPVRQDLRLR
jgi:hypothetical protein